MIPTVSIAEDDGTSNWIKGKFFSTSIATPPHGVGRLRLMMW